MTSPSVESDVIARVADAYRRRGYDVDVMPRGSRLPEFLGGFRPDLIARNPTESVVVKVQIGTRTSVAERLRDVAESVNREPGWRFSLAFANPGRSDDILEAEPAPLSVLEGRLRRAEDLVGRGQEEAAFLLFFSALEGILRVLGRRAHLPVENLPPTALFRELYSAGEIEREHFEALMRLQPTRDLLAHGFQTQDLPDLQEIRELGQALLAEAWGDESPRPG
jgi:hypothetical protein